MSRRTAYLMGKRGQDLPALDSLTTERWSELHQAWFAGARAAEREADRHRDGTCVCAETPCTAGHIGADGGHCACGVA